MSGQWEAFMWRDRPARAWAPDALAARDFNFSEAAIRRAEQATAALTNADGLLPTNWEPLARLLLRTEGIASSSIEGVQAPLLDVALAEVADAGQSAGWIADNLHTVADALTGPQHLTVDTLHRWHRSLMSFSALEPAMIGAFRTAPSWIGGTSPLDAAFVPPTAEHVPALIDDLVAFANADHFDPVTQAAIVHGQFETIHPYGDGNGRLGRILIGWVLMRRGLVTKLPPPISVLIGRDPGGYISGLHLFREGPIDQWINWFAGIASSAATHSADMVGAVTAQLDTWHEALRDLRSDAAAARIINLLPQVPVLTSASMAELLSVSDRAAREALRVLEERGILERVDVAPKGRGRPIVHYAASTLLDATAGWAQG